MPVVTISGQIGAGARDIGRLAAAKLGIDYVDQEILVEAASELGVPVEAVASHDERAAGLGERLASMLRHFLERSAAAGPSDPMLGAGGLDMVLARTYGEAAMEGTPDVSDKDYIATLDGIIRDLATQDNVLIIGRGSQVFLHERPGTFHALLVAPLEDRVRMYAGREKVEHEEAEKRVRDGDKGRVAFHEKFLKVDPDEPTLYHMTLNTALLAPEETARLIASAAVEATT